MVEESRGGFWVQRNMLLGREEYRLVDFLSQLISMYPPPEAVASECDMPTYT